MLSKKQKAIQKYLSSPGGSALLSSVQARNLSLSQISDTVLPDDFEFEGAIVRNGQWYKTVGEVKAIPFEAKGNYC